MRVLFLDFDGVLNDLYPQTGEESIWNDENEIKKYKQKSKSKEFVWDKLNHYEFMGENPPRLHQVYDLDADKVMLLNSLFEQTDCKVVFSTAWRGSGVSNLSLYLAIKGFYYPERCISRTAYLDDRSDEIKRWLDEHPEVEEFAILDDEKFKFYDVFDEKNIFIVKGLTKETMDDIIELMK